MFLRGLVVFAVVLGIAACSSESTGITRAQLTGYGAGCAGQSLGGCAGGYGAGAGGCEGAGLFTGQFRERAQQRRAHRQERRQSLAGGCAGQGYGAGGCAGAPLGGDCAGSGHGIIVIPSEPIQPIPTAPNCPLGNCPQSPADPAIILIPSTSIVFTW